MKRARGFTLIEVMVALAIVATALPALMMLITNQLQGAGFTREKTQAFWVAENQMTRLRLRQRLVDQWQVPDTDSGNIERGGINWYWELQAQDTEVEDFRRLDIRVYRNDAKDNHIAMLTGFVDE